MFVIPHGVVHAFACFEVRCNCESILLQFLVAEMGEHVNCYWNGLTEHALHNSGGHRFEEINIEAAEEDRPVVEMAKRAKQRTVRIV